MGIAHAMVWATGQCSCMPRCMHRFWLHTSTMMHASAIGHRGSAPLQAASTPLLALRSASDELQRLRLSGIVRRGVSARSARDTQTNEIRKFGYWSIFLPGRRGP